MVDTEEMAMLADGLNSRRKICTLHVSGFVPYLHTLIPNSECAVYFFLLEIRTVRVVALIRRYVHCVPGL
jgi:hypothetical protein